VYDYVVVNVLVNEQPHGIAMAQSDTKYDFLTFAGGSVEDLKIAIAEIGQRDGDNMDVFFREVKNLKTREQVASMGARMETTSAEIGGEMANTARTNRETNTAMSA